MNIFALFWLFAKIGLFTIGGGYAIVPLIQQAMASNGLMTLQETIDMVGISQMTPGPLAVNAATFAGMKLGLTDGSLWHAVLYASVSTFGVVLPSVSITMLVGRFFFSFNKNTIFKSVLSGVRPIVVGLIFASACTVAASSIYLGGSVDWPVLALAIVCFFVLSFVKKVSPVMLILASGVIGAVFLR